MSTNGTKKGNINLAKSRETGVELLASAKAGNQAASAELLRKYEPLIQSLSAKLRSEGMTDQDFEEFRQDARVEFFRALDSYDLECEGVEFGLYAKICISNALTSCVRAFVSKKRRMPIVCVDDEMFTQLPSDEKDTLEEIASTEHYAVLCKRVTRILSPYENDIWWQYVSGKKTEDIAVAVGKDAKSVSNAIYRIRKKLRTVLGECKK